jgi:Uma2 family endonuclease
MADSALEDMLREFLTGQHSGHDVEIRNGEIVVVSPHDLVSSSVVVNLASELNAWVRTHNLGHVFESNGGFRYDDGDLMAPDVSYISRERLPHVPRSFAKAVPELVIEVQSSTQRASATRAKLQLLLQKGSTVAIYIDPGSHHVEIFRDGAAPEVYTDGQSFELADILPGLRISVASLWPN